MAKSGLLSPFEPKGDQPAAIEQLSRGVQEGRRDQVLLGITGSGKTFNMAKVIEALQRPTLVIAHNKTLAAQLFQEFRGFFPSSAVEYFVSYYDYYQPEAYVPQTDTYIAKESMINEEIDRMRMSATRSLFERRDVIIVASVSCIYGLGSPEAYHGMLVLLEENSRADRDAVLRKLVEIQYERSRDDLRPGSFRVHGDVLEIWPAYEDHALRVQFFDDEVELVASIDPLRGTLVRRLGRAPIYPNSHYVTPRDKLELAIRSIRQELKGRLAELEVASRLLEAQRLEQRTMFDLEMIQEVGYCQGIENYSRHLTGRKPGEPPPTLMDYLPSDHLICIDERHQTVPQLRGMYNGDISRKKTLVEYGFRLPSALDNRPLKFEEFQERRGQTIYVSATPAAYELSLTGGEIVEQVIRPTGLVDPQVAVRPIRNQVDDLLGAIRERAGRGERVLVTTLTKRMAEDLTEYYRELSVRVEYLHSDIDTLDRVRILRDLRRGEFDVLVGVNLLREGLDLPEVSLVAVLDADKEGFLRSKDALIQTIGRAARNVEGHVIMYADVVTRSMQAAIEETYRRREIQIKYNQEHGIEPASIQKEVRSITDRVRAVAESHAEYVISPTGEITLNKEEIARMIKDLESQMKSAAKLLEFEKAAALRDQIIELRRMEMA